MSQDGPNPSFPRAIPHGTVIIDLLTRVVFFGVSSGWPRAVSREGFQSPSGDGSEGCLRALFRVLKRELAFEIEVNR